MTSTMVPRSIPDRIAAEIAPYRRSVVIGATAATVWALWAAWGSRALPAVVITAAAGAALTVIDLRTHRLPNAITYPTTGVVAVLLVLAAALGDGWQPVHRAALGALMLGGLYLLLHLVNRAGMGMGDIKLAPVLGGLAGWFGWPVLVAAATLPFLVGGVVAVTLMVARRANRNTALAFGPFMLAGTALALTWARLAR